MPATKSELSNKEDFRGDILDRDFPVHFDAKSGTYSYDYADVSAALASELDKIKYFRVSSPKLVDVEEEVVKHLKAEGPKPPPVKGNITKATEEFQKKYGETQNVVEQLAPKINAGTASSEERAAYNKAISNFAKLDIEGIVAKAKKQYNFYQERLNAGEKEANFSAEETEEYTTMKELLEAYEELEELNKKTNLTPAEKESQQNLFEYFVSVPSLIYFKKNIVGNVANKGVYNNARAMIRQIEGIPNTNRSAKQLKNLANAKAVVRNFEASNPNVEAKRLETEGLAMYVNAKKKLNALSKKTLPLSDENTAEQAKYQNIVNDYSAAFPNTVSREEMGTLQEYNANGKPIYKNLTEGAFKLPNKFEGFENNAPKTKGGKRRTRKSKKSKRKTQKQKRKH